VNGGYELHPTCLPRYVLETRLTTNPNTAMTQGLISSLVAAVWAGYQ
jgi:hypothetical protein